MEPSRTDVRQTHGSATEHYSVGRREYEVTAVWDCGDDVWHWWVVATMNRRPMEKVVDSGCRGVPHAKSLSHALACGEFAVRQHATKQPLIPWPIKEPAPEPAGFAPAEWQLMVYYLTLGVESSGSMVEGPALLQRVKELGNV